MLYIKTLTVGQLAANCFLIYETKTLEAVVVDPGDDADYLIQAISDLELVPLMIIATHGHFDHVMAVTEIKLAFDIPFVMNSKDEFLLQRASDSMQFFTKAPSVKPVLPDKYLVEGDEITIGSGILQVIATPGHTPGSVSLYAKQENTLFAGDLVFEKGGVGRTDFAYSNHGDLTDSIATIAELPADTIVYTGHGQPTSIREVREYIS